MKKKGKTQKASSAKKPRVRRIEVVGEAEPVAGTDADGLETAQQGAATAPTGAEDEAVGPTDATGDTAPHGAGLTPASETEPRPRRVVRTKEPKPFAHDPRMSPLVGHTLTHTDRNGTVHTVEVLADGFEYGGQRFRSLSAAAKVATGGKSVNGLLYFGVIKSAAGSGAKRDPVESLTKAFTKYRDRADAVVKSATAEDLAKVCEAIRQHVEALQEIAACTVERVETLTSANDSPADTDGAEAQ